MTSVKSLSLIEKFIKYGMDISSLNIQTKEERNKLYKTIEIYISEMLNEIHFDIEIGESMVIFDGFLRNVLNFKITDKNETFRVVLNEGYSDKNVQKKILTCFFLAVKELYKFNNQDIGEDKYEN